MTIPTHVHNGWAAEYTTCISLYLHMVHDARIIIMTITLTTTMQCTVKRNCTTKPWKNPSSRAAKSPPLDLATHLNRIAHTPYAIRAHASRPRTTTTRTPTIWYPTAPVRTVRLNARFHERFIESLGRGVHMPRARWRYVVVLVGRTRYGRDATRHVIAIRIIMMVMMMRCASGNQGTVNSKWKARAALPSSYDVSDPLLRPA